MTAVKPLKTTSHQRLSIRAGSERCHERLDAAGRSHIIRLQLERLKLGQLALLRQIQGVGCGALRNGPLGEGHPAEKLRPEACAWWIEKGADRLKQV